MKPTMVIRVGERVLVYRNYQNTRQIYINITNASSLKIQKINYKKNKNLENIFTRRIRPLIGARKKTDNILYFLVSLTEH